jgi:FkbM family methyltransferase
MSIPQAKSLSHRLFKFSVDTFARIFKTISHRTYIKVAVGIVERLDRVVSVKMPNGSIKFQCDSYTAVTRAAGAHNREPDTLRWIDTFDDGDIFLDIGSNVGVFSLYAAVTRNVHVFACDPLPQNHHALIQNVVLNNVADRVTAICAAINDRPAISALMIPAVSDTVGGAGATFGESYDNYQQEISASYCLNTIGISIDDLVERFGMSVPNHIKVDIDGIMEKVVAGAGKTLENPTVRSVMLELQPTREAHNKQVYDEIMRSMNDHGFRLEKSVATSPNTTADIEKHATNNFFVR